MLKFILLLLFLTIVHSEQLHAESIKITELAVTTKVSKNKPIDSVHRISHHTVKTLYCFTRTINEEGDETHINHLWLKDGKIVKETTLPVNGKRWRTYSSMPIDSSKIGNWKVEIRCPSGKIIKEVKFRIH